MIFYGQKRDEKDSQNAKSCGTTRLPEADWQSDRRFDIDRDATHKNESLTTVGLLRGRVVRCAL